jgi:hypothetical protein
MWEARELQQCKCELLQFNGNTASSIETYLDNSIALIYKHAHTYSLVQAVASSPSLFDLASVYTIRNVQENQDEMESKGTHQLLVHAVNLLGENVRPTTTKKTPTPVVSNMEGDLEINAKELSILSRLVTRCLSSSIFSI